MPTSMFAATVERQRGRVGRDLLILSLLASALFLPGMATRELWGPDETRYTEVAREMAVSGDCIVPRLNGEVYRQKPPMFFWLTAGLYSAGFGRNAGRALAALASAGTALLTYLLARRLIPRPGPLIAGAVTMTLLLFTITAKAGVIDPLLTFFMVAAVCLGLRAMEKEERQFRLYWLGAYLAAALAVLTKGPVGLLVPLVVLLGVGVASRGRARAGGWIHLAGVVLLLAVVGAWLALAWMQGGEDYVRGLLSRGASYAARAPDHRNPPYYYALVVLPSFVPWALLSCVAAASALVAWRKARDRASMTGLVWFAAGFVLFSLSSAKRAGYLLPLFPAVGLLTARYLVLCLRGSRPWPRAHRVVVSVTFGLLLLAAVLSVVAFAWAQPLARMVRPDDPALAPLIEQLTEGFGIWVPAIAAAVALIAVAAWRAVARGAERVLVPAIVSTMLVVSVSADLVFLPRANALKSLRPLVAAARQALTQADEVFLYQQDFDGEFNLHTGRTRIPVLGTPEELTNALARPVKVAVIGRERRIRLALGPSPGRGRVVASLRQGNSYTVVVANWN